MQAVFRIYITFRVTAGNAGNGTQPDRVVFILVARPEKLTGNGAAVSRFMFQLGNGIAMCQVYYQQFIAPAAEPEPLLFIFKQGGAPGTGHFFADIDALGYLSCGGIETDNFFGDVIKHPELVIGGKTEGRKVGVVKQGHTGLVALVG